MIHMHMMCFIVVHSREIGDDFDILELSLEILKKRGPAIHASGWSISSLHLYSIRGYPPHGLVGYSPKSFSQF